MIKPVYIKGYSCISAQDSFDKNQFSISPAVYSGNSVVAMEPDYKAFVNPVAIRRMSRIVKMGIATAKNALQKAGINSPDAIIFGTGLGCMEDTEKFLKNLIDSNEQESAPTSFISSTHNSVAASIALQLKCLGYNFTYVHKSLSLHSALIDAMIQLNLNNAENVLAGGIDEHTEIKHRHYGFAGWWKENLNNNLELFDNSNTAGTLAGEGAASFILSKEKGNSHIKLSGTQSVFNPKSFDSLKQALIDFLAERNLNIDDIDLLISGNSGDNREIDLYTNFENIFSENTSIARFKHLSGTYYTCDNYALYMACVALETQSIPDYALTKIGKSNNLKRILVYNSSQLVSNVFHLLEWED